MADINPVAPLPQLLKRQDISLNSLPMLNITVSGNCGAFNGNTTITYAPQLPDWALPIVHHSRRTKKATEPRQKRAVTCTGSIDSNTNVAVAWIVPDWELPGVHRGGRGGRGGHHKRTEPESVVRRWLRSILDSR